jgi:hypothetical protein
VIGKGHGQRREERRIIRTEGKRQRQEGEERQGGEGRGREERRREKLTVVGSHDYRQEDSAFQSIPLQQRRL